MGFNRTCGFCGAQVYTTGTRMPPHETPGRTQCHWRRPGTQSESEIGFDTDPWVYSGGLPELGKDR